MSGSELGSSGLSDPCGEGMFSTSMGRPGHLSRKTAEPEEGGGKAPEGSGRVRKAMGDGWTRDRAPAGPVCPSHWTL